MTDRTGRNSTPQSDAAFGAVGNVEFLAMLAMIVAVTILVGLLLTQSA